MTRFVLLLAFVIPLAAGADPSAPVKSDPGKGITAPGVQGQAPGSPQGASPPNTRQGVTTPTQRVGVSPPNTRQGVTTPTDLEGASSPESLQGLSPPISKSP